MTKPTPPEDVLWFLLAWAVLLMSLVWLIAGPAA